MGIPAVNNYDASFELSDEVSSFNRVLCVDVVGGETIALRDVKLRNRFQIIFPL
jgi:hypothetical protein